MMRIAFFPQNIVRIQVLLRVMASGTSPLLPAFPAGAQAAEPQSAARSTPGRPLQGRRTNTASASLWCVQG
ncbi:MAG TPA: hypothetical protein PLM00_05545, partial [Spirochaetota bacterium]|nr:hypothetical protein [Spirochaetota bacterium]